MKSKSPFQPILILGLLLASVATLVAPQAALAAPGFAGTQPWDLFVLGTSSTYNNPVLFRMDTEGAVIWQQPLPFTHFLNQEINADRNLMEDAFYMIADAYFRSNQIDGKNRVMRYTGQGQLDWDIPLSPNTWVISANPVKGGIYVADTYLGIYRMNSAGDILWGPLNFGLSGTAGWAVTTDTTDGGAFVSEMNNNLVMKIEAQGTVLWSRALTFPVRLEPSPADGGVFVGTNNYSRATTKLDADGTVEWTRDYFPSLQNSPRNVNPFDGNLYVIGAWSTRMASISPSGTQNWNISSDVKGIGRLAVEMHEGGAYLYGGELWDHLGITKINALDGSIVWRRDPGFYVYTGGDPTPSYLVYAGLPSSAEGTNLIATVNGTAEIYPGDAVSVRLDIQGAEDLYAAQAGCEVDPVVLELQGGTFGDFFDPVHRLAPINQVNAAGGTWLGAISQQNPAGPLSGDGLLGTISFSAVSPGTTGLICEPVFSDRDGFALPVTYSGTDITVLPFAVVNGIARYQGRTSHGGIIVGSDGIVILSGITDESGAFSLDEMRTGVYTIKAEAPLYLPACAIGVDALSGLTTTLDPTNLLGGDLNDDEVINIGDLARLGAGFGTPDTGADINEDATVNVQDLAILGGNYEISGCQDW
jgi:hypothetical protein